MSAAFFALSMPLLRIHGESLFYLPTALLHYIPGFNGFRVPCRYSIMVMLFLPILSFYAIKKTIFDRISGKWRIFLFFLLAALIMTEYAQKPYKLKSKNDVPGVFREISALPDGAMLEIPFGLRDRFSEIGMGGAITDQMFFQTVHRKPIASGYISSLDKETFYVFLDDPLVRKILEMMYDGKRDFQPYEDVEIRDFHAKFGFRYILVYPYYRGTSLERFILKSLAGQIEGQKEFGKFLLITLK
ncbi:MAG: hypothetical protein FJ088_02565 [Deltaproteobacteria bacterium]|nr:hypothetical protein [Deltaproteobacteria bacterium]